MEIATAHVQSLRRFHAAIDSVDEHHAARLAAGLRANVHLVCIQGRVPEWPCAPFGLTLSLHEVALGALDVHGGAAAWQRLTATGAALLADLAAGRLQAQARFTRSFDELAHLLEALRHRTCACKPLIRVR